MKCTILSEKSAESVENTVKGLILCRSFVPLPCSRAKKSANVLNWIEDENCCKNKGVEEVYLTV